MNKKAYRRRIVERLLKGKVKIRKYKEKVNWIKKLNYKAKAVCVIVIGMIIVYNIGITEEVVMRQSIYWIWVITYKSIYVFINYKNKKKEYEYVEKFIERNEKISKILKWVYEYVHVWVIWTIIKVVIICIWRRMKNLKILRSKLIKKSEKWIYYIVKYVVEGVIRECMVIYNQIKEQIFKKEYVSVQLLMVGIILCIKSWYIIVGIRIVGGIINKIVEAYEIGEEASLVIYHQYMRELPRKVKEREFKEWDKRRENAIICKHAVLAGVQLLNYRMEIKYRADVNFHIYDGDVVEMIQDHEKLPISIVKKKGLERIFKGISAIYSELHVVLEHTKKVYGGESLQTKQLEVWVEDVRKLAYELGDLLYEYVENEEKYQILIIVEWYKIDGQTCNIAIDEGQALNFVLQFNDTINDASRGKKIIEEKWKNKARTLTKRELKKKTIAYIKKYNLTRIKLCKIFNFDMAFSNNLTDKTKPDEIKKIMLYKLYYFTGGEYPFGYNRTVEYGGLQWMIENWQIEKFVWGDYEYTVWLMLYMLSLSERKVLVDKEQIKNGGDNLK